MPNTNEFCSNPIDVKDKLGFDLPFEVTYGRLIGGGASFYLAIQYNLTNLYTGYAAKKDKRYAIICMWPFFQFFVILFLASFFSTLWYEYCALFLIGFGISMTHVTGYFNLMSSANTKFNPVFVDPFVFVIILYADYNQLTHQ